jgi:centrosomal protein CEP95
VFFSQMLDMMKQELRKQMEKEIAHIQNEMFRDEDNVYFREIEAARMKQDLHMAKYEARI